MFAYCTNNPVNFHDPTGLCKNTFSIYFKVDCNSRTCKTSSSYNPGFIETFLQHMARPRKEGRTSSVGITGGSSFGGATGGKSRVLSVDNSYNYEIQESTSYGGSTGLAGSSAGLQFTFTNAPHVHDLTGTSSAYGVTIVGVAGLSVDYIEFVPASRPNTTCWGINVVIAFGAEGEIHASENYTTSESTIFNPFLWLHEKLYGGE